MDMRFNGVDMDGQGGQQMSGPKPRMPYIDYDDPMTGVSSSMTS